MSNAERTRDMTDAEVLEDIRARRRRAPAPTPAIRLDWATVVIAAALLLIVLGWLFGVH